MGEVEYLCRVLLFRKIYCLRNYILSLTYFPAKSKALIKPKSARNFTAYEPYVNFR